MKKSLLSLLLVSIVLAGCKSNMTSPVIAEPETITATPETVTIASEVVTAEPETVTTIPEVVTTASTMTADELFQKKQECIKYKDALQKNIDIESEGLNHEGSYFNERIKEIFYSNVKNSCFAVTQSTRVTNGGKMEAIRIIDLLTNEMTNYDLTTKLYDGRQEYNSEIKYLKGE